MKIILLTSALLLASAVPLMSQTQPVSTGSDDPNRSAHSDSSRHGYGWIGLLGLAGLAGLRRQKSVEHQRMAASGVRVQSVPVHLPE
jgi:MYXO-CTERM domain-containing protein